jgi:hypothetical protein
LKIDVEGYEDRVLLPFVAAAPRSMWPRRILMETHWRSRWEQDCLEGLREAGYRVAWEKRPDCLLVLSGEDGADRHGPGDPGAAERAAPERRGFAPAGR